MSLFRSNKRTLRSGGIVPSTFTVDFGGYNAEELRKLVLAGFDEAYEKPKRPKLPVDESNVPVLAQRAVRVRLAKDGAQLRPVTDFGHGVDLLRTETAVCNWRNPVNRGGFFYSTFDPEPYRRPHDESEPCPAVRCECGFYAVPLDADNSDYDAGAGRLVATVQLAGRIIEEERPDGTPIYRAAQQRILSLTLPGCEACGSTDGGVWVPFSGDYARFGSANLCRKHTERMMDGVLLDVEDLGRLGVPVTVGG